jgi:hypothetical protein
MSLAMSIVRSAQPGKRRWSSNCAPILRSAWSSIWRESVMGCCRPTVPSGNFSCPGRLLCDVCMRRAFLFCLSILENERGSARCSETAGVESGRDRVMISCVGLVKDISTAPLTQSHQLSSRGVSLVCRCFVIMSPSRHGRR